MLVQPMVTTRFRATPWQPEYQTRRAFDPPRHIQDVIPHACSHTASTHADERLLIAHRLVVAVLDHYVVGTALNNRGGRDQGEPRLLLQLLDVERAAVAHGGLDLVQRGVDASFSEPA